MPVGATPGMRHRESVKVPVTCLRLSPPHPNTLGCAIMATTSNPNDYDPPDMSSKRRELELVEQRGDVLHFPDPIPP